MELRGKEQHFPLPFFSLPFDTLIKFQRSENCPCIAGQKPEAAAAGERKVSYDKWPMSAFEPSIYTHVHYRRLKNGRKLSLFPSFRHHPRKRRSRKRTQSLLFHFCELKRIARECISGLSPPSSSCSCTHFLLYFPS